MILCMILYLIFSNKIDFKDYYHEDGFWIDKKDVYKFSAVKKILQDKLELIKQSNKFNI